MGGNYVYCIVLYCALLYYTIQYSTCTLCSLGFLLFPTATEKAGFMSRVTLIASRHGPSATNREAAVQILPIHATEPSYFLLYRFKKKLSFKPARRRILRVIVSTGMCVVV